MTISFKSQMAKELKYISLHIDINKETKFYDLDSVGVTIDNCIDLQNCKIDLKNEKLILSSIVTFKIYPGDNPDKTKSFTEIKIPKTTCSQIKATTYLNDWSVVINRI